VHRAGDLAAEVLLGAEEQARDGGRDPARIGDQLWRALGRAVRERDITERSQRLDVDRERVPVAFQGAALALQDVDLRFHERRPLREQDELGVEVGSDCRFQAATRSGRGRRGRVELLDRRDTSRLVPFGFRPGLLDQQLHLAELRLELRQLISHLPGELGQAGGRRR
jgi:hypothetical protein